MARRTSEALAEAEGFFREAIERDPEFALAHVGLADALTLQVDYGGKPAEATLAEAEATLAKAFQLDPNLAEAWASSGVVAQARAQHDTAERAFRRAIELNPNYAPAHQWLSLTLRHGTRLQGEHEHAQRAVDLDPLSAITVLNLGHTLERLGRFDEAATRYRRVIEIDPQFPQAFSSLSDLEAYARNRFVEAMPLLERAVALDAGNASLAADLALLRHDLGDTAEATQLIAALVDRWPDDLYTNAVAGIVAELSGDHEAAERHGRAALNAYPRVAPPLATLRNIDLRKGETAAAYSRYTSAYPELMRTDGPQVNAGNYQAAIDVALVLQSLGMLERAEALLDGGEQAIRSLPRLGWSGYGISDVRIHALRGDKAKALAALREAEKAGWRGPIWRFYRDVDPNLASIRNEPEFKTIFADIERDMARQRAALAARPKDAPLELGSR
jgi:tetratricopeptide (TPR) repeat protein